MGPDDDDEDYDPSRWVTATDGLESFTLDKTTDNLTAEQRADNEKHAAFVKEHSKTS